MATKTFDTLELVEKLKNAGVLPEQAEADVSGDYLDHRLDKALTPIYTDLAVLKWLIGAVLAGIISLVMKSFF